MQNKNIAEEYFKMEVERMREEAESSRKRFLADALLAAVPFVILFGAAIFLIFS